MLKSVTITTQKSTTLEEHTKKITCTFFDHWNSRDKCKVSPVREFTYPGHRINGYCEVLLSQILVISYQKHVRRYSTNQKLFKILYHGIWNIPSTLPR